MTNFYKIVDSSGYISGFGTNGPDGMTAITEADYTRLSETFQAVPKATDGYAYRLLDATREWVPVQLPPVTEPELTDEEALDIILGGAT